MRWPWRRRAVQVREARSVGGKALELQTAKEILAEVFGARPGEVEEMIRRRLEERSWGDECEEGLWPREFWVEV